MNTPNVQCDHCFRSSYYRNILPTTDPTPVCRESFPCTQSHPSEDNTFKEMVTSVENHIAEKNPIPYSGKPAQFQHSGGNWNVILNLPLYMPLCPPLSRKIEFESCTEGSLLKKLALLGFTDGSVKIQVEFAKENSESFSKFLNQFGMDLSYNGYFLCSNDQTTRFFDLIVKNNEIPEPELAMIREIIAQRKSNKTGHMTL